MAALIHIIALGHIIVRIGINRISLPGVAGYRRVLVRFWRSVVCRFTKQGTQIDVLPGLPGSTRSRESAAFRPPLAQREGFLALPRLVTKGSTPERS